jgi:hypothetical protein
LDENINNPSKEIAHALGLGQWKWTLERMEYKNLFIRQLQLNTIIRKLHE